MVLVALSLTTVGELTYTGHAGVSYPCSIPYRLKLIFLEIERASVRITRLVFCVYFWVGSMEEGVERRAWKV